MRRPVIISSILAVLTFAVYWPARNHDFIYYDDPQFITENKIVKAGITWKGVVWVFTNPVVGNWHPITMLSHMLDCELFGTSAGAQHLMSAGIHSLNGVLLFLLLFRMTGSLWRSALVAGVFALHPLRVESVAWVSERKDVLSGFFGLLALVTYDKYARNSGDRSPKSKVWYGLTLLLFAFGLMSKPMLVTWPFVMLLLDFWPLKRVTGGDWRITGKAWRALVVEKIPFLALTVAFCLITLHFQNAAGAMNVIERISMEDRIGNAVMSCFEYIGKLFWPIDLAVIYPHPSSAYQDTGFWPTWLLWMGAFVLASITWLFFKARTDRPMLAVGWLWFVGTLSPVIGLIQVGEQSMADRYTYLPMIGLTVIVVWFLTDIRTFQAKQYVLATTAITTLILLASQTRQQLSYWKDTVTLFTRNLEVTPANPSAEFAVGVGLEKSGRIPEAIQRYENAVRIDPKYHKAHYNLGQIYRNQARFAQAERHYQLAIEHDPRNAAVRLNLASVLASLDRPIDARREFETVLGAEPNNIEALNNLAWLLATHADDQVRNGALAVTYAERGCFVSGYQLPMLIGTLAAAYAEAGRFDDAIKTSQQAHDSAVTMGAMDVAAKNLELMTLYQQGRAYHEPPVAR